MLRIFPILLFLSILSTSLFSEENSINLLYYHPKVKILHKKKTLPKKVSANTYIAKANSIDARFLNSQEKIKGIDIVKKTITIPADTSVEFKISIPLNHTLHFQMRKSKERQNAANPEAVQVFLNESPSSFDLKSELNSNLLKIKATSDDVILENVFLIRNAVNGDKPDILFIVIDSLRADVCGFNGANFNATPNLDKFAKSSYVFQKHLVNSSWTRPST